MGRITPEDVEVVVGRPSPYSTGGQSTSDTTIDTVDFEPEIGEVIEPATQVSLTEGSDAAQYIALSIDDARAGNFIDSYRIYYQYWDDLVFVYEGDGVYAIYHRGDDTSNPNNILGRTNQEGYNAIMGIDQTLTDTPSDTSFDAAYTTDHTPETGLDEAHDEHVAEITAEREAYTTDHTPETGLDETHDDTTSSSSGPERMTGREDAEYGYYPESASGQQAPVGPSLNPEDTQTGTLRDTLYSASDIGYSRQTQQPPIGTITSTGVGSHTPEATIAPNPEAAFQEEFQTSILPRIENDELQFGGINVFRPSTAEIEFNGYPAELSSDMGNYVVTYTDNQGTEISQVFSGEDGTYIRTIKN